MRPALDAGSAAARALQAPRKVRLTFPEALARQLGVATPPLPSVEDAQEAGPGSTRRCGSASLLLAVCRCTACIGACYMTRSALVTPLRCAASRQGAITPACQACAHAARTMSEIAAVSMGSHSSCGATSLRLQDPPCSVSGFSGSLTLDHVEQEEAKGIAAAWEKDMAAALERAELDPATRRWFSPNASRIMPVLTLLHYRKARGTLHSAILHFATLRFCQLHARFKICKGGCIPCVCCRFQSPVLTSSHLHVRCLTYMPLLARTEAVSRR